MSEGGTREFRPELLSRRGEWTAWALAFAASIGMFMLGRSGYIPVWAWFFWAFLLFSGVSISLGNWMDRHTFIRMDGEGIRFENGLRRAHLEWAAIKRVAVLPARFGRIVQVVGDKTHFEFKTGGEVQFQGEVRGRTGFSEGQAILDAIVREAGMKLVETSKGANYYERG